MLASQIIIYTVIIIMCIFDIYLAIRLIEYIYCASIKHQPPLIASTNCLRRSVIEQIIKHYPESKTICEIGSGFGGLARAVAKKTNADVYALENMHFSAFVSKTCDLLFRRQNNHTILCDAFEYLERTNKQFDVAIAYLGPTLTKKIQQYKNKIKVLISLDFEIKDLEPAHVIDLSKHGYTIYKRIKYPHKLFIYEFK